MEPAAFQALSNGLLSDAKTLSLPATPYDAITLLTVAEALLLSARLLAVDEVRGIVDRRRVRDTHTQGAPARTTHRHAWCTGAPVHDMSIAPSPIEPLANTQMAHIVMAGRVLHLLRKRSKSFAFSRPRRARLQGYQAASEASRSKRNGQLSREV